ncbi:MAG: hypothetical protein MRY83_06290 [Flavobacteriales bacterium]|nr:hypothetical protein [Flavobacteriales bacterium]
MKSNENITIKKEILKVIFYFDIFKHPLKIDEIAENIGIKNVLPEVLKVQIESLKAEGIISERNGFIFTKGKENTVEDRVSKEERAKTYLLKAKRMSRIIASFPFVRCVFISGSLSKMTMEKDGDIDYFIITSKGRMWLAKTLLILFKKTALLNSKKYFCVNFFLSDDNLHIKNRNHFTATEITYLIPTYNLQLAGDFLDANKWTTDFYPNFRKRDIDLVVRPYFVWMKGFIEFLFKGVLGKKLEEACHNLHVRHKRKKFKKLSKERFNHQFKSEKNISNHFPVDYQKIVLEGLEKRLKGVELLEQGTILS